MYPIVINGSDKIPMETYIEQKKQEIFSDVMIYGAILFRDFGLNDIDDFHNVIKCFHKDFTPYLGGATYKAKR